MNGDKDTLRERLRETAKNKKSLGAIIIIYI